MKTLLVLSDSHGNRLGIGRMAPLFAENDFIIHLGDGMADMCDIRRQFSSKTYLIEGNCDSLAMGDSELELEIEGVRVLLCHGHRYNVKSGLSRLVEEAKARGASLVLYGHTHYADITETDGVTLVNPGSFNRYAPSYAYVVLHRGKITAQLVQPHGRLY